MAGTNSQFDASAFRQAVKFAMNMAAPTSVNDRATFRWTVEKTFTNHDPANQPYVWTETPTSSTSHADVQIPVAVRPASVSPDQTDLGTFTPEKIILTVLDDNFVQVDGASHVLLGEILYEIDFVAPPQGLFEVTIYDIYAHTDDLGGL